MTIFGNKKNTLLYKPSETKDMNVVVFGSGSGTNLKALLEAKKKRGSKFCVQAIFTDRKCGCHEIAESNKIPLVYLSFYRFYHERLALGYSDHEIRRDYDTEVTNQLLKLSEKMNFHIDLIVLAGYMRIVTPVLLGHFNNKIINVHPADLTIKDETGRRKYVGSDTVYDALVAGEKYTRSCVILVDEHIDTGPIILSGPKVMYEGGYPVTRDISNDHQNKQKHQSDWPCLVRSVELIADGKVSFDESNRVMIEKFDQFPDGLDIE
ncbi:MAG: formyltransferase family protein [Chlamydiota bacterium]|nr:formyltransferase family protein [Chlamydiota bacterium]